MVRLERAVSAAFNGGAAARPLSGPSSNRETTPRPSPGASRKRANHTVERAGAGNSRGSGPRVVPRANGLAPYLR
jgi:hypothetical protein